MSQAAGVDISTLPPLLLPEEAAAIMRKPVKTVYDLAARGEIPRVKLGRSVRIPKAKLLETLCIESHSS